MRLPREAALALAFVSDDEMRALNARHRGRNRVTDVLSFGEALPEGARGPAAARLLSRDLDGTIELGDVVIAGDQARRQSERRRWSLAEEVAFLAAHGALHLMGYEDDTRSGYREMRLLGEEALERARGLVRRRQPKH